MAYVVVTQLETYHYLLFSSLAHYLLFSSLAPNNTHREIVDNFK